MMKTLLFLLLLWPLSGFWVKAQAQPNGPWHVVHQQVRVGKEEDWWGNCDTTTTWQTRTTFTSLAWDVSPDSIRLFLNCDNPLLAPAARSGIRFTATGATLRLDKKQEMMRVFPTAAVVVLVAHQGGNQLFRHEIKAIASPPPRISCFSSWREADDGPRTAAPLMLAFRADPDIGFTAFMPEEARYRVAKSSITLMRGDIAIAPTLTFGAKSYVNLSAFEKIGKVGDQLKVEVQLERMNSRGNIEKVDLEKQFLLPFPENPWSK